MLGKEGGSENKTKENICRFLNIRKEEKDNIRVRKSRGWREYLICEKEVDIYIVQSKMGEHRDDVSFCRKRKKQIYKIAEEGRCKWRKGGGS